MNKKYLIFTFFSIIMGIFLFSLISYFNKQKSSVEQLSSVSTPSPSAFTTSDSEVNFDANTRIFNSPDYQDIPKFKLKLPDGWRVEPYRATNELIEFTSSDNNYKFIINNLPRGGANCIFVDDYTNQNHTQAVEVEFYGTISTDFGNYRVGKYNLNLDNNMSETRFVLCDKRITQDKTEWNMNTTIGTIGISAPPNYSDEVINGILRIIESIEIL